MGIDDIPQYLMIDLDECDLFVETANRKHGKVHIGVRGKKTSPHAKAEKWNVLMTICGENGVPGLKLAFWSERQYLWY